MTFSHLVLLSMRNVSDKLVEKIKSHILCSITFFFLENLAVYEIMPKNTVETDRPQTTIWRMWIACWTPKAKNTSSEYIIFITIRLQQWLHERTSVLSCRYIALLNKTIERRYVYYLLVLYILCNKWLYRYFAWRFIGLYFQDTKQGVLVDHIRRRVGRMKARRIYANIRGDWTSVQSQTLECQMKENYWENQSFGRRSSIVMVQSPKPSLEKLRM